MDRGWNGQTVWCGTCCGFGTHATHQHPAPGGMMVWTLADVLERVAKGQPITAEEWLSYAEGLRAATNPETSSPEGGEAQSTERG